MTIRNFSLKLDDGRVANFTSAGDGPRVAYVVGPGSFYLNSLSELYPHITFVTCDDAWTRVYGESSPRDEKEIEEWTLDKMVEQDTLAIKAIKGRYGCSKVALFGFSAPGGVLGPAQILANPEDIACFVGTGIGLSPLDPTFSATTAAFKERAAPERQKRFDDANENFANLKAGLPNGVSLPTSHFSEEKNEEGKPHHRRILTPNSEWVESSVAMGPKILASDDDVEIRKIVDDHWRYNAGGEKVMCEQMRVHFFTKIYSQVDTVDLLKQQQQQQKIPVCLIQGKEDFVTPLDPTVAHELALHQHIALNQYENCGHMPYREWGAKERYVEDVGRFVEKETPVKHAASASLSDSMMRFGALSASRGVGFEPSDEESDSATSSARHPSLGPQSSEGSDSASSTQYPNLEPQSSEEPDCAFFANGL